MAEAGSPTMRPGKPRFKIDSSLPVVYFCRLCEDVQENELAPEFESWRKQGKQKVIVGMCVKCKPVIG